MLFQFAVIFIPVHEGSEMSWNMLGNWISNIYTLVTFVFQELLVMTE